MRTVVYLVVLTAGLLVVPSPAWAAPERIAVVDMLKVIEQHPETAKIRTKVEQRETKAEEDAQRSRERLDQLKKDALALPAQDPERLRKERQFALQAMVAKFNYERELQEARDDYVRALERIFIAVRAVIRTYAMENRIQLVFQKTEDDLNAQDRNDFILKTALRAVVYYDNSPEAGIDITDAILKKIKADEPK